MADGECCVCRNKSPTLQSDTSCPTFTDLEGAVALYQEKGYIVIPHLFSAKEVAQSCSEISKICSQWYDNYLKTGHEDFANDVASRRAAWRDGSWRPAPGQEELGFRKLFRMTLHSDFFARMAKHEKVSKLPNKEKSVLSLHGCRSSP